MKTQVYMWRRAWVVALLCAAACGPPAARAWVTDCTPYERDALPDKTTNCTASPCRRDLYAALSGIYTVYNADLDNTALTQLNGPWRATPDSACQACYLSDEQHLDGSMAEWAYEHSLAANSMRLPAYCCWPGVLCCSELLPNLNETDVGAFACERYTVPVLLMTMFQLRGRFAAGLPYLKTLEVWGLLLVDFKSNNLSGTIPDNIDTLTNLYSLGLGNNLLTGTLPESLGKLKNLASLMVEFNNLNGTLPNLCPNPNKTTLETLWLRSNNLTGTLDLTACTSLVVADLQDNGFSGAFPLDRSTDSIAVLRLRNNFFSGPLPESVNFMQSLIILDVSNNSLTGPLPPHFEYNTYLLSAFFANNYFNGSLPTGLLSLSQLTTLDLSGNLLTGTIPDMSGMLGLQTFSAASNYLRGPVPPSLGNLPFLTMVNLLSTFLTCCSDESFDTQEQLQTFLKEPQNGGGFLTFANVTGSPRANLAAYWPPWNRTAVWDPAAMDYGDNITLYQIPPYVPNYDNMLCRAPVHPVDWAPQGPKSDWIANPANLTNAVWLISPEYFTFLNCECVSGYVMAAVQPTASWAACGNATNITGVCWTPPDKRLLQQCVPVNDTARLVLMIVLPTVAFLILAVTCYCVCCRRVSKFFRLYVALRKRVAGVPNSGVVSIVVTDIEGYSNLMKSSPELMLAALTLHNNIIRKCKYNNIGYTIEQEGDSYLLVFHDPEDAVAFCLQAQQALHKAAWPQGLPGCEASVRAKPKSRTKHKKGWSGPISGSMTSLFGRSRSGRLTRDSPSLAETSGMPMGLDASEFASAVPADGSDGGGAGAAPPPPEGSGSTTRSSGSRLKLSEWLSSGFGAGAEERILFRGLRVRMGVATGPLSAGRDLKNSPVFETAKIVSDAGNGGQVLMCHTTFGRIKERLHELGAVDAYGLNYRKLTSKRSFTDWLCCRLPPEQDEAVVLDMGEYQLPEGAAAAPTEPAANAFARLLRASLPALPHLPAPSSHHLTLYGGGSSDAAALGEAGRLARVGEGVPSSPLPPRLRPLPGSMAEGPWTGEEPGSAHSMRSSDKLRLYQILPPPLVGRALQWGNKLALKDEMTCSDMPYFDAPGSLQAPLGEPVRRSNSGALDSSRGLGRPSMGGLDSEGGAAGGGLPARSLLSAPPPRVVMPPVTMVFTIVEGSKGFVMKRRGEAREVHRLLAGLMREALRHVPGGYLCRVQEGDLKYMVAFATPHAALEWCLMVQEAAMYLRWPSGALLYRGFAPVYDASGDLIFRGPRLKMGVCEGPPKTIIPDHLGRADYHGASINQSARYMDAGAHGGQIVAELGMVRAVMAHWALDEQRSGGFGEEGGVLGRMDSEPGPATPRLLSTAELGPHAASFTSGASPADLRERGESMSGGGGGAARDDTRGDAAIASAVGRVVGPGPVGEGATASSTSERRRSLADAHSGQGMLSPSQLRDAVAAAEALAAAEAPSPPPPLAPTPARPLVPAPPPASGRRTSMDESVWSGASASVDLGFASALAPFRGWMSSLDPDLDSPPASSPLPAALTPATPPGTAPPQPPPQPPPPPPAQPPPPPPPQQHQQASSTPQPQLQSLRSVSRGANGYGSAPSSASMRPVQSLRGTDPRMVIPEDAAVGGTYSGGAHSGLLPSTAAAAGGGPAAPPPRQCPAYVLPHIPKAPRQIEVHWTGVYKFKGNPAPVEMVCVLPTALTGRLALLPDEPPKGKGNRLEARRGLADAIVADVPCLASEYRERCPDTVLSRVAHEAAAARELEAPRRMLSLPVGSGSRVRWGDGSSPGGSAASGSGGTGPGSRASGVGSAAAQRAASRASSLHSQLSLGPGLARSQSSAAALTQHLQPLRPLQPLPQPQQHAAVEGGGGGGGGGGGSAPRVRNSAGPVDLEMAERGEAAPPTAGAPPHV